MSSVIDSVYDTPDPIIYGEDSSLNDVDFGSLFAIDDSTGPDDLHFFKDGFNPALNNPQFEQSDSLNGDSFTFDSLLNLDACQPSNKNDLPHGSDDSSSGDSFSSLDSSSSIAATSSAQQPFSGASH